MSMKSTRPFSISITDQGFDPWQILAAYDREYLESTEDRPVGGISVFVGTMRDINQGRSVSSMCLEHYPGMTETYLEKICEEACDKWEIQNALVVHRSGEILPGEPIVLVAVRAGHRDAAFSACRFIIDELKQQAPFWKKEDTESGSRWVEPI